jgi:hypothetical protein
MRPADRGKQQRIRLRGNDAVKAWIDGCLKVWANRLVGGQTLEGAEYLDQNDACARARISRRAQK